jgi:hypothetical protein
MSGGDHLVGAGQKAMAHLIFSSAFAHPRCPEFADGAEQAGRAPDLVLAAQ